VLGDWCCAKRVLLQSEDAREKRNKSRLLF
jgi:hypothetical protein